MSEATAPRVYPAIVRAVSYRTRRNPGAAKISRATALKIMTAYAGDVDLDQVTEVPPFRSDVRCGPYQNALIRLVLDEWRAEIGERAEVTGHA